MEIYQVGGAVRDTLLGLPVTERDWVVVGATPEAMLAKGFKPVGKDFPVFLHPDTKEEYALARTERKTGPGYSGFEFFAAPNVTLEEDLLRRDLTVNAMAQSEAGVLIDPYGGQEDLKKRILRHVSSAFVEDPVRILRVARFAARFAPLGFKVAEETIQMMQEMVDSGEANALVAERVWKETQRALCEEKPSVFFEVLRQSRALPVVFPEIAELYGVPNPAKHHPEIDTGTHVMMVLDAAAALSPLAEVRFAALVHDLGKAEGPMTHWPAHHGHEVKGLKRIDALCKRLRVPKDYHELAMLVAKYHTHCHRAFELKMSTLLSVLEALDVFRRPQRLEHFLLACEADAKGRTGFETAEYPQADYFRDAYGLVSAINAKPFVEQGFQGKQIKKAMHEARVSALKEGLKKP